MQQYQYGRALIEKHSPWKWTLGILAAYAFVGLVLAGLIASHVPVSEWISEAAEAEFAGAVVPGIAPTRLAAPADQMRVVRRN